ncbi:MAG: EAL domain-containing protein [Nitrospirae bacterium]|nr:EAL domain-containing protein [Nitrospirota bacterium]
MNNSGFKKENTSRISSDSLSPVRLLNIVGVTVFLAEASIMLALSDIHIPHPYMEAAFDGIMLTIFLVPVFYLALYRPMRAVMAERMRSEEELQKAYAELELRVRARTQDLCSANERLTLEIENRMKNEEQLSFAASVFMNTIEGIAITDESGNIQRVNPGFTTITGYSAGEVLGRNPRILKSSHHPPEFYRAMWDTLLKDGQWKGEIWNRRKNGELYPEWLSITAIRNANGRTTNYVSVFHDITDIKSSEEKLAHQAYHDALTGLPNRQLFNDRLKKALAHTQRHDEHLGLLFLDLDNFKNINDTLGHKVGDIYLQRAAALLRDCSRDEDTVTRLGGDEFTIMMPSIRAVDDPVRLAVRILESFSNPVLIEGHELNIGASIGITIAPDDGVDAETLIKNADMAMYRAKETGKNNYQVFTREINEKVHRTIQMENDLRKAVERYEFIVLYQPKVRLSDGKLDSVEALVRWVRPEGEIVSPADFIPIAESTGLVLPIGEWVLRTACRQARKWHDEGYPIGVSVNLSPRQFAQDNLFGMIADALAESGLPPEALEFEITEGMLLKRQDHAIDLLRKLRSCGIKLSIDDFGTGYSSLAYLKQLPINSLKLDRIFVQGLPSNADDATITFAVVSMATSLGLATVAEGVETAEQLAFLDKVGCEYIQGYYFSRPVSSETLTGYLREGKRLVR